MKITNVECSILSVPLKRTLGNSRTAYNVVDWVVVQIHTDEGISGTGHMGSMGYQKGRGSRAMKSVVDTELKEVVVGKDPFYIEKIRKDLWAKSYYYGQKGLAYWGISAIDTALWDIVGKATGKPLYKLLGGCQDELPVYGSGIDLSWSLEELIQEVTDFVEQGFKAVKIKVGKPDYREDLQRVKAVREAIGDDIHLMVDANQAWRPAEAIQIGKRLEEYNIYFLEEPVSNNDIPGMAKVAAALDVPIAAGEMEFTRYAFRELLTAGAIDIVQPDPMRNGGITECMKICTLADTWNLPVTSHFYIELMVHVLAAIPNALYLEYIQVFVESLNEVIVHPVEVKNGMMQVPQRPGHGVEFSKEGFNKYRIA